MLLVSTSRALPFSAPQKGIPGCRRCDVPTRLRAVSWKNVSSPVRCSLCSGFTRSMGRYREVGSHQLILAGSKSSTSREVGLCRCCPSYHEYGGTPFKVQCHISGTRL